VQIPWNRSPLGCIDDLMGAVGAGEENDAMTMSVDFAAFYRDSWPRAVRVAAVLTQDASVADEVAQEALLAVMQSWDRVRVPGAYLHRCLVNAAAMHHRRVGAARRRVARLGGDEVTALGFDDLADSVAALPFRQRAVIVLRFHLGLSEREIAEALGCRPGTVKSLSSRALAALREGIA
jgi:RNA polymerase sigma factor (sigma-70 family)